MSDKLLINESTTEKTSVLLARVLAGLSGDTVRFGSIVYQMRSRSFGGVFILLAALGLVPGISIFAGLVMIFPAIQMAIGFRAPRFPKFLRERVMSVERLQEVGKRTILWMEKIERLLKPRWLILTTPSLIAFIGWLIACLALVVLIPLPFSNFLPSISILCLAFGLLERDGRMICLGFILSAIALVIGYFAIYFSIEVIGNFFTSVI